MNKKVSLSELSSFLLEILQDGGEVILTVTGCSMAPMLRHRRDKVCLAKSPEEPLQKYDLPLFIRSDGRYILHRIVEVAPSGYTVMGDNQCVREYPVLPSQVIGVVRGFWRDGRYIACNNPLYLLYCRLWCFLHPVRLACLKGRHFMKRCAAKLFTGSRGDKNNEG